MAREAGLQSESGVSEFAYTHRLEHFSELVRADEREACAKVCDDLPAPSYVSRDDATVWDVATLECGDAIRAQQALDKKAENARELGLDYELVQERNFCERCGKRLGDYIHTCTPPAAQRTWVGLTDEEIDDLYQGAGKNDLNRAREIEAKLKEKNT
jgi:hypothetical protein